jgi:Protein of unknown function (DUF2637)
MTRPETPTAYRWSGYLLIVAVMAAAASMSWSNLDRFALDTMHWTAWHAVLVPIGLDVAAVACGLLALDTVMRNDSAVAFRMLTAALIGLSAFLNWRETLASHNVAEEVFFPMMAILSYALIDSVLRKYRRDTRRDRAGQPAREALEPLPRFGLAAAITHPRRAWRATSTALARRVPDSAEYDEYDESISETRQRDVATGYLAGLSQSDAIRRALETVGEENPRQVVAWLAENGRPGVAPQRVYDVLRRSGKHRALRAVAPAEAGETEEGENVS